MWKMIAALGLISTAAITVPALAETEGNPTTATGTLAPVAPLALPASPCSDTAQVRRALDLDRWQEPHPLRALAYPACRDVPLVKLKARFHRWRVYRQLTPYTGCQGGGRWLTYTAIPGSVVYAESRCSWSAVNGSSGACGAYQLLFWTSCDTSSWADKMRHHRMAAYVLQVQGPGAWTAW